MSSSPLHVNVTDNTPLHIHLRKAKQNDVRIERDRNRAGCDKTPSFPKVKFDVATSSPSPFVKKSTMLNNPGKSYKWKSSAAQLEITKPLVNLNVRESKDGAMRPRDLLRESRDQLDRHMVGYDKKIKGLISEVGTLMNETKQISNELYRKNYLIAAEAEERLLAEQLIREDCHYLDRHMSCFIEKQEHDPVHERVKKALAKLHKSAHKMEKRQNPDEEELAHQSSLADRYRDTVLRKMGDDTSKNPDDACGLLGNNDVLVDGEMELPVSESTRLQSPESKLLSSTPCCPTLLRNIDSELETRRNELCSLKCDFEDKREELRSVTNQYNDVRRAKSCLQKSLQQYQKDIQGKQACFEKQTLDNDALLRHLAAVEVTGGQAKKQVLALRDVIQRLHQRSEFTIPDIHALNKHKDLLLKELDHFALSLSIAEKLIPKERGTVNSCMKLQGLVCTLSKKLHRMDDEIIRLQTDIRNSRELNEISSIELNEIKNFNLENVASNAKLTSIHLQKAVMEKDEDNERLRKSIQEMSVVRDCYKDMKRKGLQEQRDCRQFDPETNDLVQEIHGQKERLSRSCKKWQDAKRRLQEREQELEAANCRALDWKMRCVATSEEEGSLKNKAKSIEVEMCEAKRFNAEEQERIVKELEKKVAKAKEENVTLEANRKFHENRAKETKERCSKVKDKLLKLVDDAEKQQEVQTELRDELEQTVQETEMVRSTSDEVDRLTTCLYCEPESELEKFRSSMLKKLKELQGLPSLLKKTELRLHDTLNKLEVYDEKASEQAKVIASLQLEGEGNKNTVALLQKHVTSLNDENEALQVKIRDIYCHLADRSNYVRQTLGEAVCLEEKTRKTQLKLEKMLKERHCLQRQLCCLSTSRCNKSLREVDEPQYCVKERNCCVKERNCCVKERNCCVKERNCCVNELEEKLRQLQSEAVKLSISKQKSEERGEKKVQDVVNELERTQACNKSLKEYLNVFKSFSDSI